MIHPQDQTEEETRKVALGDRAVTRGFPDLRVERSINEIVVRVEKAEGRAEAGHAFTGFRRRRFRRTLGGRDGTHQHRGNAAGG